MFLEINTRYYLHRGQDIIFINGHRNIIRKSIITESSHSNRWLKDSLERNRADII